MVWPEAGEPQVAVSGDALGYLIAAGSMPALADLPDFPLVRPFITIASLLMVFLLSLENLFQYQEQWT